MATSNRPQIYFKKRDKWEPLTPAAERVHGQAPAPSARDLEGCWIKCPGYETIRQQIADYCDGRTSGHSFLISGHRGSGKTLLTHLAVQMVQWDALDRIKSGTAPHMKVPFLVPLHGPDVLSANAPPSAETMRSAVQQIVLALQRAYAEELLRRFQAAVPASSAEVAAYLAVQLNHYPELSSLHTIWEEAGLLLAGGVLQNGNPDQGLREIVALHTLNEAVQAELKDLDLSFKISAVSGASGGDGSGGGNHVRLDSRTVIRFVQAVAPILSLGAGFLAAYTSKTLDQPILGGTVFLITALIAGRILSSVSSGLPAGVPDGTSLAAIDRLLPIFVDRVLASGFAPVFVLDELDKIEDLSGRLSGFIRHLKYFVTDRALFCFLTDRKYFEKFATNLISKPYAPEETFFADRILIHYHPDPLYQFLDDTLDRQGSTMEYALLRRIIVFLSRIHPNILRQYLSANRVTGEDGRPQVRFAGTSCWRVPGYLMAAYMQLAIEAVFRQEDVSHRIRQKPEFTQWVLDALYYPATCWEQGKATFSIAKADLKSHLARQLGFETDPRAPGPVSDIDLDFLFSKLQDLTLFLARPVQDRNNILAAIEPHVDTGTDGMAARMISCLAIPPAIGDDSEPGALKWRVDRFGNSYPEFAKNLDKYLTSISTGDIQDIARHRYQRLAGHEKALSNIWPGYQYAPLLSHTHYSMLPKQKCDKLDDDELSLACTILSGALIAESRFHDFSKCDELKHTLLEAVVTRSATAPAVLKPSLSKAQLAALAPPAVQPLFETYWRVDRSEVWERDLVRIHRAL
jgi:Cdc6-like AAA superfamily ATPase